MAENPQPLSPGKIAALLMVEAQGGNAHFAVASLEALVRENGSQLSDEDLFALARLDAFAGTSPDGLWPCGPINTELLQSAVERVMRERRIWRRYRFGEWKRTWLGAARWLAALVAMAVGLIAALCGAVVAGSHILRWLGF
jgi:hypothetical protein